MTSCVFFHVLSSISVDFSTDIYVDTNICIKLMTVDMLVKITVAVLFNNLLCSIIIVHFIFGASTLLINLKVFDKYRAENFTDYDDTHHQWTEDNIKKNSSVWSQTTLWHFCTVICFYVSTHMYVNNNTQYTVCKKTKKPIIGWYISQVCVFMFPKQLSRRETEDILYILTLKSGHFMVIVETQMWDIFM